MDAEKKMVRVGCSHPGGLTLRLFGEGKDPMMGGRDIVAMGPKVTLNGPPGNASGTTDPSPDGLAPGETLVDEQWWAEWVGQNRGKNPLLDTGVICEIKDAPVEAEGRE